MHYFPYTIQYNFNLKRISVKKLPSGQNVLDRYKIQLIVQFGLAVCTLNLGVNTMNPDGTHIPDF